MISGTDSDRLKRAEQHHTAEVASRALTEGEAGEFFVGVAIILVRPFIGLGLQL